MMLRNLLFITVWHGIIVCFYINCLQVAEPRMGSRAVVHRDSCVDFGAI